MDYIVGGFALQEVCYLIGEHQHQRRFAAAHVMLEMQFAAYPCSEDKDPTDIGSENLSPTTSAMTLYQGIGLSAH